MRNLDINEQGQQPGQVRRGKVNAENGGKLAIAQEVKNAHGNGHTLPKRLVLEKAGSDPFARRPKAEADLQKGSAEKISLQTHHLGNQEDVHQAEK